MLPECAELERFVRGEIDPAQFPPGLQRALARAAEAVDFPALAANMLERSARALAIFETLIRPSDKQAPEKRA